MTLRFYTDIIVPWDLIGRFFVYKSRLAHEISESIAVSLVQALRQPLPHRGRGFTIYSLSRAPIHEVL